MAYFRMLKISKWWCNDCVNIVFVTYEESTEGVFEQTEPWCYSFLLSYCPISDKLVKWADKFLKKQIYLLHLQCKEYIFAGL